MGCIESINVDPHFVASALITVIREEADQPRPDPVSIAFQVESRLARILYPTNQLQLADRETRRASSSGVLTPDLRRPSRPGSTASLRSIGGPGLFTPRLQSGAATPDNGGDSLVAYDIADETNYAETSTPPANVIHMNSISSPVAGGPGGGGGTQLPLLAPLSLQPAAAAGRLSPAVTPTSPMAGGAGGGTNPIPRRDIAPVGPARPVVSSESRLNLRPDWPSVHAVLNINVTTMSDLRETVLHYAVRRHLTELVRNLLLFTPDLLKMNERGNTVLHLACISGTKSELVEAILSYDWSNSANMDEDQYDLSFDGRLGGSSGSGASSSFNIPGGGFRRSSSATSEQRFVTDERIREQLMLELPFQQDDRHPLEERMQAVKRLLDRKNDEGDCALHLATRNRFGWLVKLLLHHGADRSQKNREGDRALDIIRLQNGGTLGKNPLSRNLFVRKKRNAPGPWWREDQMTEQYLVSMLDPDYKEELWY